MTSNGLNRNGLQWSVDSEGQFQLCGRTTQQLPPGGYGCDLDCYGRPVFLKRPLESDNLIQVPGSVAEQVLDEVEQFWKRQQEFRELGFIHRRGYLFYGKQGGGKSSLIQQIISRVIQKGNVVFFCERPDAFLRCMLQFRKVEPERPLLCVFEDIEAIIEDYGDSEILQWLDGNHQVDHAINLASTNYPEQLDRRIVSRPRRFDRVLRIDAPCEQLRRAFLERKLPTQTEQDRAHWLEQTEGFTFAALSELIIGIQCFGEEFDATIERLKQLDQRLPTSTEYHRDAPTNRRRARRRRTLY